MTVITPASRTSPAMGARRGLPGGSGFFVPEDTRSATASGTTATAGISLADLLALQADPSDTATDREARRRGTDMLKALARLQRGLLRNSVDPADFARLAEMTAQIPIANDLELRGIVTQINLRVRVELARFGHFPA
jgi:hypothetical protein